MANSNTINFKGTFDVKDVLQGVDRIRKNLGDLSLGPKTQAEFDSLFQKIERNAEKANKAMASGFKNKGEVQQYEDAMRQISTGYDDIITKIKVLNSTKKIHLGIDDTAVKTVISEIEALTKKWKQAQADLNSQKKTSFRNMEKAADKYKGGAAAWNDAVEAFKNGDIAGAEQAIKRLESAVKAAKTRAGKNPLSDDWKQKAEDVEKMRKALDEYRGAQNNLTNAEGDLINKQKEFNNYTEKGAKILTATANAGEKEAESIRQSAKASVEAAKGTQQLNSELDHFKNRVAYFFGLSNAINLFKRAVRSAYDTVKDLDAVMTETAVVTNFDVGDMWAQLPEYTQRANELGVSIHSAYEAATIFYQQGLKTNEVMAVSNETLKMARIAGLDAATASDRMTNALRGFNMEMDKMSAQRVNDVYSKLAAITASDTDEISTAMTKVASLAHNANMEFETTAAFLAQIIESTRESAETAGTALKTVVARFSEVKELYSKGDLLGQDEEGEEIDVNKVSTALRSAGINLNEYLTGAKGLDDIFMELAEKWDDLDQVQQRYIATMAAGSRQQSRFIALMSDYKRTMQLVEAANNAEGASQEQYSKTLDSLETKLARLKNAWDEFILGLTNSDAIKGAVDLLTNLITVINKLISTISGKNSGIKMVTTFFTAFTTFKIGAKAFGKSSLLSGFFTKLLGDGQVLATASAPKIAGAFYKTLATSIANFKVAGGLSQKIKSSFADVFSFIDPNAILKSHLNKNLSISDASWKQLQITLNRGGLNLDQLNEALRRNGQTLQITAEEADKYGITLDENNNIIGNNTAGIRAMSAALVGVGLIFTILGDKMEKTEGSMQNWGTVIKSLGIGLMAFGTIMSVYIPLRAQLMAQKVTSAIVSIPIVGWIAAVASALIALGVAFYNFEKNNSLETKLEKSQEAAKNAAQAAEEAKEAYEKLGEAWDDLADKNTAIEEATKGTQEWRDAIREVNNAVLDLMDSYGGMIEIGRGENGALTILNQDEIDNIMRNNAYTSEGASRVSRAVSYEIEENKRRKDYFNSNYNAGSTEAASYYLPAAQVLSDYIDNLDELQSKSDEEIKELLEQTKGYRMQNDAINNAIHGTYDFDEGIKEIRGYIRAAENSARAIESERTALGATILQNANIDKDLEPYANTFVSDKYIDSLIEKNQENYEKDSLKDLQDKYAEAHGTTWSKMVENDSELEEKSADELKTYLIAQDVLNQADKQLDAFATNFSNLEDYEKALFAEQNGGGLTQEQIQQLLSSDYDRQALYDKLGGEDVFGSPEAFQEWFSDALISAIDNYDTRAFSEKFINILDTDLTKGLSSGVFENFTNNLWSIFQTSGVKGVKAVQETISNLTGDMTQKDREGFIKALNSADWSSVESIQTLYELGEQYGISEEAMKSLEDQIISLNNAARQVDLEKMTNGLALAKKIVSGEQGRSFTKEDYETAVASGAHKEDFVLNIETGNYDYIGQDIQDVAAAIERGTDAIVSQLDKDYANARAFEAAQNSDWAKNRGWIGDEADLNNESLLRAFLSEYQTNAGENSLYDWDFIQTATLEELQKAYNTLAELNSVELEEQLKEAKLRNYQTDTGAENAARVLAGDEEAKAVLKQQLANSGVSEEEKQRLFGGVEQGNSYLVNDAGTVADVFAEAGRLGINADELNSYADALRQIDELSKATTGSIYTLALANAKYCEGLNNITESYDEWIELKREDGSIGPPEDGNTEQLKTYEKLKADLKEMLNLSEDVSDEFMKMPGTAELLERAVNGDMDAVAELRAEMAKTKLIEFGIKDDEITDYINQMMAEAPTLEFGATLDQSQFAKGLLTAMEAAGMTVGQMQEMFDSLGWAPELEYEEIDAKDAQQFESNGKVEIADPKNPGKTIIVPTHSVTDYATNGKVLIPKIGNAKFVKPSIPSATPSSSGSGGGGGGGSAKKPSYWENPYDELYNLQEKINEALRTRESLERRYQKLLKQEQATLTDIRKSYYDQIKNLRMEADLQKQFAAGRLRQIQNVGNELYTDEDGDRTSFRSLGVTKYASYDTETGLIQIDWEGLEEIANDSDREEEGKAAEAYISKLEELVSSYEEVRDKLWDIEDKIEELRDAAIDSYLSFEDRVMEAVVGKYQREIDSYQAMSDAIEKANNEVLDSLREQIDLSRQIRDNTKKEEDISDMENRLAYLQRDTSGANQLEILKLQKDIENARESYTDTLVDQAIDKMQSDADLAAEQRAKQIEIMQAQLDMAKENGKLWQEVHDVINAAGVDGGALSPYSELIRLMEENESFKSLSAIGQQKWLEQAAEEFHKAWVGIEEAEDKYGVDANDDGTIASSGTQSALNEVSQAPISSWFSNSSSSSSSEPDYDEKTKYGVALAVCDGYWGNGSERADLLEEKGFDYDEIQGIVNDIFWSTTSGAWYGKYYGITDISDYKPWCFKTGGLADFTGPAWLDGTKAKPELVLNAQDTANFIALKDILASLLSAQGFANNTQKGGDNYFDIDINAQLEGDYDVDKLTEKIKRDIYNDGQYRNVNTINYLR